LEANMNEHRSWGENDVYDLVAMRTHLSTLFVRGSWVLRVKRDKDGKFVHCKARFVLKGY
ncbi:MAG: hypothetical protein ACKO96_30970, partial [Flammeovirgaceae bacterium]